MRVLEPTIAFLACSALARAAAAHGFVGNRFFPPTIQTDDPFAVDELALPTVTTSRAPRETDVGLSFSKEIVPRLALSLSETWVVRSPRGRPPIAGFDDLAAGMKVQVWQSAPLEAIVSAGLDVDLGGTGAKDVAEIPGTVFTPTLYFGKGFGDLPEALRYARPFAITATVGQTFPTGIAGRTLAWGGALEYDLRYLHANVRRLGPSAPWKNLILLVELSFTTPEDGDGPTTGTVSPGVLYESKYFQLGVEAVVPVDEATGKGVGASVQLQLAIDDLWPSAFGHPLFR